MPFSFSSLFASITGLKSRATSVGLQKLGAHGNGRRSSDETSGTESDDKMWSVRCMLVSMFFKTEKGTYRGM